MPQSKLTKRTIDALKPGPTRFTVWDTDLSGFGLRITPAGERTYVLKYRFGGKQRWYTIGRHGSPWTPDMARREALRLLGDTARNIDPAEQRDADQQAETVSELCDLYLNEGVGHKKPSTLKADRGRIAHHIKPLLGKRRVNAIARADVERLLADVSKGKSAAAPPKAGRKPGSIARGGSGVAARTVALLSTIMAFAVSRHLRPSNPARGVKLPKSRKMERFLSAREIGALALALRDEANTTGNVFPAAAVKLLLLTGCRRGEILSLRWEHVDVEHRCLRLPDSKTGAKVVYLNAPAMALVTELPRVDGNSHVIPGARSGEPFIGIDKMWVRVRRAAGLDDVRLHDLRHSFASVGASGGLSLPLIGALLGHRHTTTTSRYAHLSADPIRAANEAVGATIAAAMDGTPGEVLPLRRGSAGR
jgi:integrase